MLTPASEVPCKRSDTWPDKPLALPRAERRLGNLQKSEAAYEQAIAEFRRLADLEPGVNNHKWKLVTATLNIGGPLLEQDRQQEVVTRWQHILPVLDQLIEAQPESLRYVQVKAMLQSNIAIVLKDMGRAADAVQPLISATRILREQSRRVDDAPEVDLPLALIMRGKAKLSQSEVDGAYADAQTALTKLSQYFEPPWSGTPKEAYHDAALLMAKVVGRQMQGSKDQTVRRTKAAELQQLLETAKEMGATREEVEAVASQPRTKNPLPFDGRG